MWVEREYRTNECTRKDESKELNRVRGKPYFSEGQINYVEEGNKVRISELKWRRKAVE